MHGYTSESLVGTKSKPSGKVRGLVIDPIDVLELMRDTYANTPIPPDAKFEGLEVEKKGAGSYINFYFSTDLSNKTIIKPTDISIDPTKPHCITFKPQYLIDILKYWCNGMVPSDAEAMSFNVHPRFTLIRVDIYSNKFKDSHSTNIPLIHLRYEGGQLYTMDEHANREEKIDVGTGAGKLVTA